MSGDVALVAGASGLIGRALVTQLRADGWRVIAAGRETSRLPDAEGSLRLDRVDAATVSAALSGAPVDVVINCAAYGVNPADSDPAALFALNVAAAAAWVEAAAAIGAGGFVHVGSFSEYGAAPEHRPIREDSPLAAADLYGASKAAGGLWASAVAQNRGLPFVWMRPFMIYGGEEAQHRLFPSLRARLLRNEDVPLSPGGQMRDFVHVEDAARGLASAARFACCGGSGAFNLCSGRAASVREVAEMAARALGAPLERLRFGAIPYRARDVIWGVGDPARFAAATGFRPAIPLEEGVARVMRQGDGAAAVPPSAGARA